MRYEKRMGAQDILDQSETFLGGKSSFEESFPEIDTIKIDYMEDVAGFRKASDGELGRHVVTDKRSLKGYFPCSNRLCFDGGFHIEPIIRGMIRSRKGNIVGEYICQGNEGSPHGRKIYHRCLHKFEYEITINYK